MIPDKRLVWHPRRDDEFVVGGGTQITLYSLAREYPEIRQIASRNDLHHMRVCQRPFSSPRRTNNHASVSHGRRTPSWTTSSPSAQPLAASISSAFAPPPTLASLPSPTIEPYRPPCYPQVPPFHSQYATLVHATPSHSRPVTQTISLLDWTKSGETQVWSFGI